MNKKNFIIVLLFFFLASCSSTVKKSPEGFVVDAEYSKWVNDRAEASALSEMNRNIGRAPASLSGPVNAEFDKLQGSFEMVVFAKNSNIIERNDNEEVLKFGNPIIYRFSTERLVDCNKLMKEKINSRNHQTYFATLTNEEVNSLKCAIIAVRTKEKMLRANMKRDDIIEVRLYIDSTYRVHGLDWDIVADDSKNIVTRLVKHSPSSPLSSGISGMPIDLPTMSMMETYSTLQPISVPKDSNLEKKMKEFKISVPDEVQIIEYKRNFYDPALSFVDEFGQEGIIGWGDGSSWPTFIENESFLAFKRK